MLRFFLPSVTFCIVTKLLVSVIVIACLSKHQRVNASGWSWSYCLVHFLLLFQIEFAVGPLCHKVSDLGTSYKLLRSFRWALEWLMWLLYFAFAIPHLLLYHSSLRSFLKRPRRRYRQNRHLEKRIVINLSISRRRTNGLVIRPVITEYRLCVT